MEPTAINRELEHRLLEEFPRLLGFLRKLSPADAEDLTQETVARALKYRHAFDADRPLRSWLLKTAFRVYLDHKKKSAQAPASLGSSIEELKGRSAPDPGEIELVRQLLSRLPPTEREIVLKFHGRGERIEEISTALSLPMGTVKSHLHRARRRLSQSRERSKSDE